MTTAQAITQVKRLIDKYDDTSTFSDDELISFLNMAQLEVLNRMVPDSLGGVVNYEFDQNVFSNLKNLIIYTSNTPSILSSGNANITFSALTTSIRTQSGDSTCNVFRILNVLKGDSTPIKFVPPNRMGPSQINTFKAPSSAYPIYTIRNHFGDGTAVYVYNCPTTVFFTIMKTPKILAADNSPDWDDYVMNQVIMKAAELAGVSTHDSQAIQDTRNSGLQSAE